MNYIDSRTIEIYSQLFNNSFPKDERYWSNFFGSRFHYNSLDSTFRNLTRQQVDSNIKVLHILFKNLLQRLEDPNSLNILRVFIKNICCKNYGDRKNDVIVKIFGNINDLNDNITKLLTQLKNNIQKGDQLLQKTSFRLFAACVKGFYSTLVFEIFYQVELNDEIYNFLLLPDLEFELVGELIEVLAILNNNSIILSNFYRMRLENVFKEEQILSNLNYQLKKFMTFGVLFYYELKPDLLQVKEQNSTFYNWITFNRYNDKVSDYKKLLLDNLPRQDTVLMSFFHRKMERFKRKGDLYKELIPIYLFFYSLVTANIDYGNLIATRTESEGDLDFLEIFLSLSSFIMQHQHGYNQIVSRLNLMILNQLLTYNVSAMQLYFIDQYRVKLCYQRQPIVAPIGEIEYLDYTTEDKENKNALNYILDIAQCQMRYNLLKNLDLINYKLANLIILRVIQSLDFQLFYNWHDFFRTIFSVLKFLIKNFDSKDEKIKGLIEEILVIVELLIVKFSQLGSKQVLVELTYKILENSDFLLILKKFERGHLPNLTITLNLLITKFKSETDSNYNEIYEELDKLVKSDEFEVIESDLLTKISKQEVEFESEETFKYLRMTNLASNNKVSLTNKAIESILSDFQLFH